MDDAVDEQGRRARHLARGRAAMGELPTLGTGGLLTRGMDYRYPPYAKGSG